jgi:RNA polymerase sigma factor (sigma-70 family)
MASLSAVDAPDVTHEAFARLWQHWDGFSGDPKPWLRTVARNVAIDELRKRVQHVYRLDELDQDRLESELGRPEAGYSTFIIVVVERVFRVGDRACRGGDPGLVGQVRAERDLPGRVEWLDGTYAHRGPGRPRTSRTQASCRRSRACPADLPDGRRHDT